MVESSQPAFTVRDLAKVQDLPLLLDVTTRAQGALDWAQAYRNDVQRVLGSHGALLVRGLKLNGSAQFGRMLAILFGADLMEYTYRSTPRTAFRGNVYTATEYPANQIIPQHNENAYSRSWPARIGFLCMTPAQSGGETPIADSRVVYQSLPVAVRDRFERGGVLYVRNYSSLDLPWTEVFQTKDPAVVEQYCTTHGLSFEWRADGGLRTRQSNPAVISHPGTGEKLWFNQAHLFHVSNLGQDMAATLLASVGEENLPRHAYYGDGAPIEPEVLAQIRGIYRKCRIKFSWMKNDLLLLDNMLYTHGRESYTGPRQVLTGMACPVEHQADWSVRPGRP
jgi:alpha-ketoglutarate-dependent taurine dioxygenase